MRRVVLLAAVFVLRCNDPEQQAAADRQHTTQVMLYKGRAALQAHDMVDMVPSIMVRR